MKQFCVDLPASNEIRDTPYLTVPTYVKWSHRFRSFGVFAAADIDPTSCSQAHQCVATYGGVVCFEWEPRYKHETYSLPFPELTRTSHMKYVPVAYASHLLHRGDRWAHVDSSDMCSGDGKFMNGSCDPNTEAVKKDLHFHRTLIGGVPVFQSIMLFKPRRYGQLDLCCIYENPHASDP